MKGVRITGGSLRGRLVQLERDPKARYTSAKVRAAIFDIAGPAEGLRFLDLFAGVGSVSAEALSRGACSVTAVEADRDRYAVLASNMARLGLANHATLLNADVRSAIPFLHRSGYTYDMIFMDPPYESHIMDSTMALLAQYALHTQQTILFVEHSQRLSPRHDSGSLLLVGVKRYGDTALSVFRSATTNARSPR